MVQNKCYHTVVIKLVSYIKPALCQCIFFFGNYNQSWMLNDIIDLTLLILHYKEHLQNSVINIQSWMNIKIIKN